MARASFQQTSFRSGEWSQFSQGRSDLDEYKTALNKCLNYIPMDEGALVRRSGTQFLATARSNTVVKMFPVITPNGSFMVEMSTGHIRFFSAGALEVEPGIDVTSIDGSSPAVVTVDISGLDLAADYGWASGNRVVFVPTAGTPAQLKDTINQQFIVTLTGLNTFTLQYTGARSGNVAGAGITWTSGNVYRIHEEVTPYTDGQIPDVRSTQDEGDLYFFHGEVQTNLMDLTDFSVSELVFNDGPYMDVNTTTTTLTPAATSGSNIAVTASAPQGINDNTGFASSDVGRVIRFQDADGNWSWFRVVGFTNSTTIHVDILGEALASTAARTTWRMGLFSDTTGWPTGGIFHESRLWLFSDVQHSRVDACKTFGVVDGEVDFAPTSPDGTVADDNAISAIFKAKGRNAIKWLSVDERGLIAGTDSGEWSIRASALDDPLTPFTVQARKVTNFKVYNADPVQAGKSTLFIQALQKTLIEHRIFDTGYDGKNVSRVARHLLKTGLVEIAYAQTPIPIVWCRRTDKRLVGVCFRRDADGEQTGWHQHNIDYTNDPDGTASESIVENIAVLETSDPEASLNDTLWAVTNRNNVLCIEIMRPIFDEQTEEKDQFFVDSGVRYTMSNYGKAWSVS